MITFLCNVLYARSQSLNIYCSLHSLLQYMLWLSLSHSDTSRTRTCCQPHIAHAHTYVHACTHTSAVNSSGLVKHASASIKIHQMVSLRPTFARECRHTLTPSCHSPLAALKEQWLEERVSVRECTLFTFLLWQ